jgi:hypothetical protein
MSKMNYYWDYKRNNYRLSELNADFPINRLIAQDEAFDVLDVWMTEALRADDIERYERMAADWCVLVMEP